ncbi:MAG: energy transducer TonB [Candidatus Acidiferrales bacterium]
MPTYPVIAATAHIEGDVRASFVVNEDGTVAAVEIVSGPPLLLRATLDNIRSWKFGPINDKPTANKSFETVFYYRISPRNACENNKWLTVSTRSFQEIEITAEVPRILSMGDTKTSKSSHRETASHQ